MFLSVITNNRLFRHEALEAKGAHMLHFFSLGWRDWPQASKDY